MPNTIAIRVARPADCAAIRRIYNEGIEDRIATLDVDPKDDDDIEAWWSEHDERYAVLVAEDAARAVTGWAALNRYSHRCAYDGVAELSIYVARAARGTGVGSALLTALEERARASAFHKIVLFALPVNANASALYRTFGYREVGVFREQGRLEGRYVDVVAMEKVLDSARS